MPVSSLLINFLLFWGLGRLLIRRFGKQNAWGCFIRWALVACIVWMAGVSLAYLMTPLFYDHGEAAVASIGANWIHGLPIYTAMDSPERYSLLYGPLAMMVAGWFQTLGSQTLLLAKLPGVLNLYISSLILFLILGFLNLSKRDRFFAFSLFAASLVGMYQFGYWNRPDSYILLFVTLALWTVLRLSTVAPLAVYFVVALLMGLSLNAKIHSVIYFLPILFYFYEVKKMKWNWFGIAIGFVGFTAACIAPYLFFGVSFTNFLAWIRMPLSQGLPLASIVRNVTYLAAFLLLLWSLKVHKVAPRTFQALCFSSLVVAIVTAKPGSGLQMFIPLFPMCLWLGAWAYGQMEESSRDQAKLILGAFALMLIVNGINRQKQIVHFLKQTSHRLEEFQDLKQLVGTIPGSVEMGYSGLKQYESTFYKSWMVMQGKGLFLDAAAVMETEFTKIPLSAESLATLRSCKIPTMIFPKGDAPWSLQTMYTNTHLFSDDFRQAFFSSYKQASSSKYFDVYTCKTVEP